MAANFWLSTHCNLWTTSLKPEILATARDACKSKGLDQEAVRTLEVYFVDVLSRAGTRLKFRRKVTATAIVYFRRLYLTYTFLEINPWLAVATVLYIASKVEESAARVNDIVHLLQTRHPGKSGLEGLTESEVLECEFVVLEALDFDLIVFHPYRPLQQFLRDIGRLPGVLQTAWSIVNDSYRTDVILLYPPYLVALAALMIACAHAERDPTPWLNKLNVKREEVDEIVRQLISMYQTISPDDAKKTEELVARLEPLLPAVKPSR